ncbi:hypothetical protein BHYA_0201g00140 [Botrytis hyacinthi]|uniref:DNA2/NAM7 helicase-like C-terminal domain-containing protein n=1 Tax=Botrytis hyacinthi TaxID=278943 RepID=A0A4Z1GG20_9HELO|nr:hypothetical protein BHYA_0201g00140 [Botrytis hyacinthi]
MTSNANIGSSVPSGSSNDPASVPAPGLLTGSATGSSTNPLDGPPRPMDIGINFAPAVDSTRNRKQIDFQTEWVKKPKQGSFEDNRTQEQKDKEIMHSLRKTLSSWLKGTPVVPGNMESWSREVKVKFDMYTQVPSLKVWLDDDHSFAIRAQNVTGEDRARWTQNIFLNQYRCPIQRPINTLVEHVKNGATVKALSLLGMDIVGKFFWETRVADVQDPLHSDMEAFMTQLSQGVMHATVVRAQVSNKVKLYDIVDNHWIHLMEQYYRYGVYRWYNGSIGVAGGKLFEAWQTYPKARVQHQPWMRERDMDAELAVYASHSASYTFGSRREMEMALSLGIIGENMWEDFSILKYFNRELKHQCWVDRIQDYAMLHLGIDKDENFAMPSVSPGTRMKFWVVPLPVAGNEQEEPTNSAEVGRFKVKGKKVPKPVMPPCGRMPEDQVTEARVIEVETNLDFVLGFRCKDGNSRNAFKKGNRVEVWIEMERNPVPSNRMLKAIGKICRPPKTAIEEDKQCFLMGHGVLDPGTAAHTTHKDKMTNDQRSAFDYLIKSMDLDEQKSKAWRFTFYEPCYASFIHGPPGTGKTSLVGGQGIGLALCENQTGDSRVDDYAFWKYLVKAMKEDADYGADEEKQQRAQNWSDTLAKFKSGQNVGTSNKRRFFETSEVVAAELFSSSTSKIKIVVCTCNTADLLGQYGYKPEVWIADEAAFGTEPDQWISLALESCSKIISIGDHKQLHPVVNSHGHSEHSEQMIRRLFINVKGGKSAPKPGGKSKRNFANINAIREYLLNLFAHQQTDDIEKIDLDKITILTPYKEELYDLTRQITVTLRVSYPSIKRFPRFWTIDSIQGGQNELILLGITPADQYNGALIGFLADWNRMNRSQLSALTRKCQNFGFMVIDLLDRGDVIDVEGINALPKDKAEWLAGPDAYTVRIEETPAATSRLNYRLQQLVDRYNKEEYEKLLLAELQAKRDKAIEYQEKDIAGVDFDFLALGTGNSSEENDAIDG